MGFLRNLKLKQVRSFAKGACKALFLGFNIAQAEVGSGKLKIESYGDLAAKALSARPRWKMIEKNIFEYKDGRQRNIIAEDSLADVVHDVVFMEMQEFIENDKNPSEIINTIMEEILGFFKMTEEEESEFVRKKTREGWYVA